MSFAEFRLVLGAAGAAILGLTLSAAAGNRIAHPAGPPASVLKPALIQDDASTAFDREAHPSGTVTIATRTLDLDALSPADFGDDVTDAR